jgi:hypothetical protein
MPLTLKKQILRSILHEVQMAMCCFRGQSELQPLCMVELGEGEILCATQRLIH